MNENGYFLLHSATDDILNLLDEIILKCDGLDIKQIYIIESIQSEINNLKNSTLENVK